MMQRNVRRSISYTLATMVVMAELLNAGATAIAGPTPFAPSPQSKQLTSEQIRQTADNVMHQSDFRSVRRRVLENIPDSNTDNGDGFLVKTLRSTGEAIGDFLEWIFSGLFSGRNTRPRQQAPVSSSPSSTGSSGGLSFGLGSVLLYVGLAVLILITIWIIAVVIKSSDGRKRIDSRGLFSDDDLLGDLDVPPGELAAATYEGRAIAMANEGNYRGAVRELLIGSMSWIERAGLIRFRKGLTNRDYVRAVWRQEDRRVAYGRTAIEFERIYFGRRDATEETFNECLRYFQGSFREEETTTAAV